MTKIWHFNIVLKYLLDFEISTRKYISINDLNDFITVNSILIGCEPIDALKIAKLLNFVQVRTTDKTIELTDIGKNFLTHINKTNKAILTTKQIEYLKQLILNDSTLILSLKNNVLKRKSLFLLIRYDLNPFLRIFVGVLKDLGLIEDQGDEDFLFFSQEYNKMWKKIFSERALTEEDLLRILEKQRKVGREGEEKALEYELREVSKFGNDELVEKVKLIAREHVDYGYDIESVYEDGTHKYIEVKTTSSKVPRFFISKNEYGRSLDFKEKFWIYFVNLSLNKIFMFNNIPEKIKTGVLVLEPSNYEIILDFDKIDHNESDLNNNK